jgi:hypothetical protein
MAALFEAPASPEAWHHEWETIPIAYNNNSEFNPALEADQFFFLAPLAIGAKILAKKLALKGVGKLALKAAKKMITKAPKILKKVQNIHNKVERIQQFRSDNFPPRNRQAQRLDRFVSVGEMESAALEAEFFGSNEFEGELASHSAAREIALTELLAHEAARSEREQEAEYLLRTALPITLRIWSRKTPMSPQVTRSLLQANSRLVRDFHRQGRDGRQFLLTVPMITRRTIATMRAILRGGGQLTPQLVSQIMAAHTARVLSTPSTLGPAVVRNFAIRRATPIPVGKVLPLLQRQPSVGNY